MKRIISILLVVCLGLCSMAALAACGRTDSDGDGVRTTVSEAEWNEAFLKSNFTINGFITERDERESLAMKFSEDTIYTENGGYTMYCVKQSDGWHMTDGTEVGPVMNGVSASVSFAMMSFHLPEYSSFSYDEATKSYVYVNSGDSGFYQFNVYFEYGFISRIEGCEDAGATSHSFTFTDYGTTVVELPGSSE